MKQQTKKKKNNYFPQINPIYLLHTNQDLFQFSYSFLYINFFLDDETYSLIGGEKNLKKKAVKH